MTPEQQAIIERAKQRIAAEREQRNATTRERVEAARAGTLQPSQEALDRAAALDNRAAAQIAMANADADRPGRVEAGMRSAAQGLTFGFGDEAVAGMASLLPGFDYSEVLEGERRKLDQGREDFPGMTLGAEVAGAVAVPVGGALKGANALAKGTKAAPAVARMTTPAASLPGRMAQGAAGGAGLGAVYGFGAGEGGAKERVADALLSGAFGGLTGMAMPAIVSRFEKGMTNRANRKAIADAAAGAPSAEGLRSQAKAAYQRVDDAGVRIKPETLDAMAKETSEYLDELGVDEMLTPKAARVQSVMGEVTQSAEDGVPFRELEKLRRKAAVPANAPEKAERMLGSTIIDAIDTTIDNLSEDQVTAGTTKNLSADIKEARDTWRKLSKHDLVKDVIDNADNYLSGFQSGLRNGFKNLLQNKKLSRNFSDAEKQALRDVIQGRGVWDSVLNQVGKMGFALSGQGSNALGGMLGVGAGAAIGGGLPGALMAGAAGTAARTLSDARTAQAAEIARALMAAGGTQLPAPVRANPAIVRALTQGAVAAQN